MLQAANTDLVNPLVPKVHNSECQNLPFPLQIKPVKVSKANFYFCTLGTNGLSWAVHDYWSGFQGKAKTDLLLSGQIKVIDQKWP